ncbi:MAG: 6-phosphogluconolactonase [Chloroflexota bacterium]|nr:6-phosphogluconolactonase [Chloroflexota bacterium]
MAETLDFGQRGTVVVYDDASQVAHSAAELVRSLTTAATHDRGGATIALSGGSTPKAMGAVLREEPYYSAIPWGSLHFFWGDERYVPLESPESNAGEAMRGYLDAVPVPDRNVHPFDTVVDPEVAASSYEATIRNLVPGGPVPMFDLILLGMGDDGHTASLFPDTEALGERERLVVANHVPKLDATRLTFTYPLINAARAVVFLATGDGKAERLAEVLEGDEDLVRLPSQGVNPRRGTLTWLVDRAAASALTRS